MRIDKMKLALIVASLCGTGSSAVALGQDFINSAPASSTGRIGDGGVASNSSSIGDSRPMSFSRGDESSVYGSSIPASNASFYDPSADTGVYAGEMTGSGAAYCQTCPPAASRGFVRSSSTGWLESESLLWWGRGLNGAPTVVGGGSPTVLPTTVLAGGQDNPLGTSMYYGMRADIGKWLDCEQNYGVGARGYGLLTSGTDTTYTNGGNSTGIPFFNTTIRQPDTYLVNFDAGGANGANVGTIGVKNDLDLVAGELYLKSLLAREGNSRTDLLTGYTFLRLDSEYGLRTSFTDGITNGIQNGTVITTNDTFSTKNTFHGGHVGLSNQITRGRFNFSLMGKVAMGDMQSVTSISGRATTTPPGGPTNTENRGLFAQSSNSGVITKDKFTFIPEANAKMRYQLGRAQLGVGYTLLLLPNVAMAASQVDRNVDIGNIGGTMRAPSSKYNTEAFFLHGLDLGVTFQF